MNGLRETMYKSTICQRVAKIISEDFTSAMLITLHCSSSVVMPPDLAKRLYRAWKDIAQRIAGGPFNCIRIVDYGPHSTPEIVFFVVADLSLDVCMEARAAWYMGAASVDPLDDKGLDRIAEAVIQQTSPTKARIWSYLQKNTPCLCHATATVGIRPNVFPYFFPLGVFLPWFKTTQNVKPAIQQQRKRTGLS